MARLTITLSDERHQALKEATARRGKTIRQIIEESLDRYGIQTRHSAAELIALARSRSATQEEKTMALAVAETRTSRKGRHHR